MTPAPGEIVRVLYPDADAPAPTWEPTVGRDTVRALGRVFDDGSSREALVVREEATATLANCIPPDARGQSSTGLVIGYVQSGKTLAYTIVTALARDSGFGLVIILTGTIKNLHEQSTQRLRKDLGVGEEPGWQLFTSEDLRTATTANQIAACLNDWLQTGSWVRRETVVITVLKHMHHLDRVAELLEALTQRGLLNELGAIVIDDEADQAGLNTLVGRQDESPTYKRIIRLRSALPQHTYLQYTATPQAILLISLMDQLSPSFVQVLTPGGSYTGGQRFFASEADLIREIPTEDIQLLEEQAEHPPQSLIEALETFVVVAAIGAIEHVSNRSMLVHPHRFTVYHAQCKDQVSQLIDRWRGEMELPEDDTDRLTLEVNLRDRLRDLEDTAGDLPSWSDIRGAAAYILGKISVHEFNTRTTRGSTRVIDWDHEWFTIVVGGQKLDRGYTIRGLAVTYMPRSLGVGNADTIQQRARWFGYKEDYFGQCRVHLRADVAKAYHVYVEHEESVRDELTRVVAEGGSIRDWRRSFFLDRTLRPTRTSVIGRRFIRGGRSPWFVTGTPARDEESIAQNRRIVQNAMGTGMVEEGSNRVLHDVPLESVLSSVLVEWMVSDAVDSARLAVVNLQLRSLLDADPDAMCVLFLMRPHLVEAGGSGSERECSGDGTINQVLQGPSPAYLGDRNLHDEGEIAVQFHSMHLMTHSGQDLGKNIPVMAVHVPRAISRDWVAEVVD